jgi:hypothetical protein
MRGFLHPARTFSTQPRAACTGQLIDGEVVARAEPAIADGRGDGHLQHRVWFPRPLLCAGIGWFEGQRDGSKVSALRQWS